MNTAYTIQNELHKNCLKLIEEIKAKGCQVESLLPRVKRNQVIMWEHIGALDKTEKELTKIVELLNMMVVEIKSI